MKKFFAVLMSALLLYTLCLNVYAARKLTDEEKTMIATMQGKEMFGRKISSSDLAMLENFFMSTERPLTQTDIDSIMENIDQIIAIVLESGTTDLKNLPQSVVDKIMKIADSAASTAGLSVSLSSASDIASAVTVTSKDEKRPVIIPKEKIIKATGSPYGHEENRFLALKLTVLAALFGLTVVAHKKYVRQIKYRIP